MSTSRAPHPWWKPWQRWPRVALGAEIVLVGLLGCWLGLLAFGRVEAPVGPVRVELSVTPSLTGDSVVSVPPLGQLSVDSHDGFWRLNGRVDRLDAVDARRIFSDPASLHGLAGRVTADMRRGVERLVVKAAAAAVLGAVLLGLLVFRRRLRRVLLAGGVSAATVLAGGGIAAATWNPQAIYEPRYSGLLASAPTVVGDARSIVTDFRKYENQLAKIVTNVSRLYDTTSTLPAYTPDPSTLRVLDVSDIHLNPAAWDIMRSITKQFDIDLIVDTGDITDHGTSAENTFLDSIATLGVPYVWVRGNHDSLITQRGVARQPNAVVLDGKVKTVKGLRLLGVGDPRFTPDKNLRDQTPPTTVLQVGERLAATSRAEPVDAVLVHDPQLGLPVDGAAPLVIAGHTHKRDVSFLDQGTLLFDQGSTGGAGLRGLEHEKPTPIECSVLYFDKTTRTLQAWDDVTIGGLGLASAEIERHIYEKPKSKSKSPDSSSSPSPGASSPSPAGSSAGATP